MKETGKPEEREDLVRFSPIELKKYVNEHIFKYLVIHYNLKLTLKEWLNKPIQEQPEVIPLSDWIDTRKRLPDIQECKTGVWGNEQLTLIYWNKHKSYELAALTIKSGALVWDMPDHGFAEPSEVSLWLQIPPVEPK